MPKETTRKGRVCCFNAKKIYSRKHTVGLGVARLTGKIEGFLLLNKWFEETTRDDFSVV